MSRTIRLAAVLFIALAAHMVSPTVAFSQRQCNSAVSDCT